MGKPGMTTYSDKLKDPRWQKKRLKVLERDQWTCHSCWETEETLHVHHLKYAKSGNPWDSPMKDLKTLCESCHETYGEYRKSKDQLIGRVRSLNSIEDIHAIMTIIDLLGSHWSETILIVESLSKISTSALKCGMDLRSSG